MGFASYHEDILLRAAENGSDAGAVRPATSSAAGGPSESSRATTTTRPKTRTVTLHGEAARRAALKFFGAKEFAYLQVIETQTGRLVQEFPYRDLTEVKACLARIEAKHPGALRLVIAKRLELPEDRVQAEPDASADGET